MAQRSLLILLLAAGVGCIVLGAAWKQLFPPQSYWSEQQAQEYTEASTALKLAGTRGTRRAPPDDPTLSAAHKRFEKIKNELDGAIIRRDYTGVLLGVAGAMLLATAAGLYLAAPGTSSEAKRG